MKKNLTLIMLFVCFNILAQKQNTTDSNRNDIHTSIESLTDEMKFADRLDNIKDDMPRWTTANHLLIRDDGVTYAVVSSTNTNYENCFKCLNPRDPYNCPARYLVEARKYTQWKDGDPVRHWMKTVSIFMGCGRW